MRNELTIHLFGALQDVLETQQITFPSYPDAGALYEALLIAFPTLKSSPFRIAVNHKLAGPETALGPGDEIALLPPFAGG
ncbi:MAG: MoaD/ThiS family protein [Bacteroidetes bacterium]|nr:MoaD/ThiS family protein [Bacteroidota bacterium]